MNDEMVLRSIYLGLSDDSRLRQIAFEVGLNKSILIRSAIAIMLDKWVNASKDEILGDVEASKKLVLQDDLGQQGTSISEVGGGTSGDNITDEPQSIFHHAVAEGG